MGRLVSASVRVMGAGGEVENIHGGVSGDGFRLPLMAGNREAA